MKKCGLVPLLAFIFVMLTISTSYALIDDFTIEGGAPYINYTYAYGDYLYIVNASQIQKWSIVTRVITDTINLPLFNETHEVLRKGSRLYIDATLNSSRRLICVQIEDGETFAIMSNVDKDTTLTESFYVNAGTVMYGLERVEYFLIEGHDIWTWGHTNSSAGNIGMRAHVHVNTMRGTFEQWGSDPKPPKLGITACMYVGTEYSGNTYLYFFHHNMTTGLTGTVIWTYVGLEDHVTYYHFGSVYYDFNTDSWTKVGASEREKKDYLGGDQFATTAYLNERSMNIQFDNYVRYNVTNSSSYAELYGSAYEWGWRSSDEEEINRGYTINNLKGVWMDTETRVAYIYNLGGGTGSKTFRFSRFDTSAVPHGSWVTPQLLNNPRVVDQVHGVSALFGATNATGSMNHWLGYVNHTNLYPVVDWISDIADTSVRQGQVLGNFTIIESKVFEASRNIIALYTINGTNDIVVQRNLVEPQYLEEGGFAPMNFLNATITYDTSGDDGAISQALINGSWIFEGEVYTLTAFVENVTSCYLTLNDTLRDVDFHFLNSTGQMWVDADYDLVAGLVTGEYTRHANQTYELKWVFILDVNINDCLNRNMTYYITDGSSNITGVAITGINIYNLGGFISYNMQADGGRVTGGDWLEIHQTNGTGAITGAYAETIYRRLQHVHVLWSLDVENNACFDDDEDTGYVYMGIQYLNSLGNWVDGWYMRVRVDKGAVDAGGGGAGKAWVSSRTQWYARDENGTVSLVTTSQYLSGYPECGDDVSADITRTRFYTDLWFNTANSSTTVGGRLNTYYFGMDEAGWLLWNDWRPVMLNMTEAMMFTDLRDVNGDIIRPNEIELMKFWVRVLKVADATCDSHTWSIRNPQVSYQLAEDRMRALNTPDGVETIIIDMPSTGWLQPIAKAIQGISNAIWAGALNFIKIMLGAVDSMLLFLNSPVTMSQMIQWIMIQSSYITAWMAYVITYISQMLLVFSNMIQVLANVMTTAINIILWVLTYVVGFPLAVLSFFVQILSGQATVTYYSWTFDFSSVSGLIDGAVQVAPFGVGFMFMAWLFWGNIYMEGDVDETGIFSRIMQTIRWFRVVYNDVFWIYNRMRNEIISLYNFIRSHIPSLGGSGGEIAES